MKVRLGFVSNSSSASFVVGLPTTDKSAVLQMLYYQLEHVYFGKYYLREAVKDRLSFSEKKLNEAKLLAILCRFINENMSSVDLCEGVWGKGMANEGKRCALKNLVTNLRKVLSEDGSLQIINRRWSGYALTNIWTL